MVADELSEWQKETVSRVRRWPPKRLVKQALNPRFTRYLERVSLEAWLERAEGFLTENPRLGREMALRAPQLVGRAALSDPELELRAWTLRGCMLKVLGELAEARQAFRRAAPLEHEVDSGCPELAAMWEGYALLESIQGHHAEALDLADRALALLQSSTDQRVGSCDRLSVPHALVVRGMVLGLTGTPPEVEMTCFLEALRLGTERTALSNKAAAHNLVIGLTKALLVGESIEVDLILQWCKSLHCNLKKQGEPITSPARCRLHWVEAQVLA